MLAEALAAVNRTGERFYEAELYRLKGQLTLQSEVQGPKSQALSPIHSPKSASRGRDMFSEGY